MLTVEIGIALKAMASPLILLSTPSMELGDDSVPEPDIALAWRADGKAVSGEDVVLAVEISDTTLEDDLGRKMRLYAMHGIAEYWVANVERQVIHQLWSPDAEGYAEQREAALGERIEAATVAGLVVDTRGLG
jgi:Uma2 family endonuclease